MTLDEGAEAEEIRLFTQDELDKIVGRARGDARRQERSRIHELETQLALRDKQIDELLAALGFKKGDQA